MSSTVSMTDTLDAIYNESSGDKITVGDMVEALNSRGFGALLIGPSLIVTLPTGAIPGIPALCGVFIFAISIQAAFGKKYPWLPQKLRNVSFSREKFKQSREKIKPYVKTIDNFFHPRFEFLTNNIAQRLIALFCSVMSIVMMFVGFVPMMPAILAIPILFFGLGLSVHDGLLTALGFLIISAAAIVLPFVI